MHDAVACKLSNLGEDKSPFVPLTIPDLFYNTHKLVMMVTYCTEEYALNAVYFLLKFRLEVNVSRSIINKLFHTIVCY